MKKLILLLMLLLNSCRPIKSFPEKHLDSLAQASLFLAILDDDLSLQGWCGGTHIGEGLVLTAAHCMHGQVWTKYNGIKYPLTQLKMDKSNDLMLLGGYPSNAPFASIQTDPVYPGAPVWAVGVSYPMENTRIYEFSFVQGESFEYFYIGDVVAKGYSGGAFFDLNGNLVCQIKGMYIYQTIIGGKDEVLPRHHHRNHAICIRNEVVLNFLSSKNNFGD